MSAAVTALDSGLTCARGWALPIRLVSELNAHEHWRVRQKRAKAQHQAVGFALMSFLRSWPVDGTVVRIIRIAPRSLDSDNLVGSAKHVRDAIAGCLAIDDRDPRVEWIVRQERGKPNEYACRIEITRAPEETTP